MVNIKKQELIEELKALRLEKNITYQEIATRTEENGEAVSLNTIKLVFSATRHHDHDYNKVLRPHPQMMISTPASSRLASTLKKKSSPNSKPASTAKTP